MLDIKKIRNQPEEIIRGLQNKNQKNADATIDSILKNDESRRLCIEKANALKNQRNVVSQQIAKMKKAGDDATNQILEMRTVSEEIKEYDQKIKNYESEIFDILLQVPNLPSETSPVGKSEDENVEIRHCGEKRNYDFELSDHLAIGKSLGLFDFNRGSKISGSGFPLYTGKGAKLERALINFMLDYHAEYHGYTEIFPPFLVNRDSLTNTGQIPKLEEDMYFCERDELFLIPTAEVPVTNIFKDEILKEDRLPIKYSAYSSCFRREAGSWGKETKGFLRLHQFNKIELVNFVSADDSFAVLERLTNEAEKILQVLGLHYRVLELCTGDLSFSATKCYDLEVWAPAEKRYLEVSSCSNFTDFQARRGRIRYRRADGKVEFVHTLNGSGVATPRLLVALLETYQQPDGSILIPEILQPYTGFQRISPTE